jgi:hypothetical protein
MDCGVAEGRKSLYTGGVGAIAAGITRQKNTADFY